MIGAAGEMVSALTTSRRLSRRQLTAPLAKVSHFFGSPDL